LTRPLEDIRSHLRGAWPLAGVTTVTQEKFGALLREAEAACSPSQWKALLAELSMSQQTADYYLGVEVNGTAEKS
jgi:hypothetical protein